LYYQKTEIIIPPIILNYEYYPHMQAVSYIENNMAENKRGLPAITKIVDAVKYFFGPTWEEAPGFVECSDAETEIRIDITPFDAKGYKKLLKKLDKAKESGYKHLSAVIENEIEVLVEPSDGEKEIYLGELAMRYPRRSSEYTKAVRELKLARLTENHDMIECLEEKLTQISETIEASENERAMELEGIKVTSKGVKGVLFQSR
jgi:hypothetical protein